MRKLIVMTALLIGLAGCSNHWHHTNLTYGRDLPGGYDQALQRDWAQCSAQGAQAAQGLQGAYRTAAMSSVRESCMEGKGWNKGRRPSS